MSHLGSRISALVDGQLSVDATERALAHVASCALCAEALAHARAARRALAECADDVPPAPDLTARLLSLASSAPAPSAVPPPPPRDPFAPPSLTVPALHGRQARALRGDVAAHRSVSRIAATSLAGVGALAAMLFVMGEQPAVVPVGHPGTDLDLLGSAAAATSARTTALADGMPAGLAGQDGQEVAAALRDGGWSFPTSLPTGWSVADVRWSDETDGAPVLEVDLAGPEGTLVVTEQEGRLDLAALDGADVIEVGGRQAYVLSYAPWHAVWQCDDTVVQVVAGGDASSIVAAFPGGAYDDGVPARIWRGWSTVTGALEGS
ncbi:zf-HC2 domain-containing protein [Cellulomonas sp. DKR-3]|uniref:Zf-HC2 domain-containing protein n=1 Tax=Cellulomonas fulva TaxID=2835530 RepID=A0ABS5TUI8_9CELL|nr:zf-HC2 domain-containing protein [Cellulomonas fulva]MBT0992784.1 zf-HC2 domain-containing protein [Cellulomonas fulva]